MTCPHHREDDADLSKMLTALKNGSARALVLDRPVVEYLAGNAAAAGQSCNSRKSDVVAARRSD